MTTIDLSQIAVPDAIETLDFETILSEMTAAVTAAAPDLADDLSRDSSLPSIVLQVVAFREMLLRARVNDGVRAVTLARATGADLENLAALYGVARLVVDPGDPGAIPPVPPTLEDDATFRARVQQAPEGWAAAGPVGAYRFHALSASGAVKDVSVTSPEPGVVRVGVLSRTGSGTADAGLLGEPLILVDGLGFALQRWVILRVTEGKRAFLRDGAPRRIDFSVELQSYGEDGTWPPNFDTSGFEFSDIDVVGV